MRAYIFIVMIFIVTAGAVFAQTDPQQADDPELKKSYLYQWTDDRGVVHITDGLGNVPEKFRSRALKMEQTERDDESGGQIRPEAASPAAPDEGELNEDLKAEWQLRIRKARQGLAEAEQRHAELDLKRQEALGKGSPATGNLAGRSEAEQIQLQMELVQKEIDDIRHELEVVIPDDAHKAGVPPGWLRE
jgi:hypothetical protein